MFTIPEQASDEWIYKVFELGENGDIDGIQNLFCQTQELYFDEYHIYNIIQQLTNDESFTNIDTRKRLLKQLEECSLVKGIRTLEDGFILVETKKDTPNIPDILITRLSDLIFDLKDDHDLGNSTRLGQCHTKAQEISLRIGFPNEVVTGYFHALSDKARFLHSWIEFSGDEEDYVIDYTMNAVMNKKGYYFIRHVKELCRINNHDILSDLDLFGSLEGLNIKEYMVFRHEMARDLERTNIAAGNQFKKVIPHK